jgi:hypothetical protein
MTTPGLADTLLPLPPKPRLLRILWRLRGPSRTIVAEIHRHPVGRELIVGFEDAGEAGIIETRVERGDGGALEARAAEIRTTLVAKGWTDIKPEQPQQRAD